MYKYETTYTDFFGEERKETLRFHYSEAELAKMELSTTGGITRFIDKIVQTKDNPKLVDLFESFILDAYGEISEDGRRFVKSDAISEAFKQTPAYSDLFMKLLSDDEALVEFITGVVPEEVKEKMKEVDKQNGTNLIKTEVKAIESKD